MSDENYNRNWKTRLQELSSLPGEEQPDVAAAWKKLEARLSQKKKNRKPVFYWLAAACVLMLLTIAVLPGKNNKEIAAQSFAIQNKTVDKNEVINVFRPENLNDIVIKQPNKKDRFQVKSNKKALPETKPIIVMDEEIAAIDKAVKDSLSTGTIDPQDIKSEPVVFLALRKKIPVVHINDLEKPLPPLESTAGNNNERWTFRVNLFNRNIPHAPSYTENSDNFNVLKIKLPSQN